MAECQWPEVGPASGGPETPRLGQLKIIPCLTPPLVHYDRTSLVGEIPGPPLASISQRSALGFSQIPGHCATQCRVGVRPPTTHSGFKSKTKLGFHSPAGAHTPSAPIREETKNRAEGRCGATVSLCRSCPFLSAFNTQVDFDSTARSPSSRTWQRRHISRPLRASARVLCRSAAVPVRSAASGPLRGLTV